MLFLRIVVKIYVTICQSFSFLSVQFRRIKCIRSVAQPSPLLVPKLFCPPNKLCDHHGLWLAGRQWAHLYPSARAALTEHHRLKAHTAEASLLTVLEAGSPRPRCQHVSFGILFRWLNRATISVCSLCAHRSAALQRALWSLFLLQGHQSFRISAPPS